MNEAGKKYPLSSFFSGQIGVNLPTLADAEEASENRFFEGKNSLSAFVIVNRHASALMIIQRMVGLKMKYHIVAQYML